MSQRGDRGRGFRGAPDRGRGRGDGGPGRGDYRGRGGDRGGGGGRGGDGYRGRGGGRGGPPSGPVIFGSGQKVPITVNDHDSLVQSFKSLSISSDSEPSLPLRPGSGTIGTPIQLRANYFALTFSKSLYEYEVKIDPKVEIKRVRTRIYELLEASPAFAQYRGRVAHDSSTKLISAVKLPQDKVETQVVYYEADEAPPKQGAKTYKITANFIRVIEKQDLDSYVSGDLTYRTYDIQPTVAALNIVLSRYPSHGGVMVGRNKFFFTDDVFQLGAGLEARKGFFTSVRPSFKQLMVNVNVATTAFYKEGLLTDAIRVYQRETYGGRLNVFLRGVRVQTSYLPYKTKKTIFRVHSRTARQEEFQCDELRGKVSVEKYFREKYKITLKHPTDMPLMDLGNKNKSVFVPAELCSILPNQPFRGKLSEDHTAAMILHACQPPAVNATAITVKGLPSLGFAPPPPPNNPLPPNPLQEFGISVSRDMAVVPGRILPAPRVIYSGGPMTINAASWNLRDVKFKTGADLGKWAVLAINDGGRDDFRGPTDPMLVDLVNGFADMCRRSGMTGRTAPKIVSANMPAKSTQDLTRGAAIQIIKNTITGSLDRDTSIILVILSSGDKHIYSGVKRLCDCILDVKTVCVQAGKFKKGSPQYFANVALKANLKLGGTNHGLDAAAMTWFTKKPEPAMLVGADVTHPGPGSLKGTPSIAAVVASNDRYYGQYPCSLRLQESRKEMITELKEMMIDRLKAYKAKNNTLPSRVLFFRDGVSEGQFMTVVMDELPKIQAAFNTFSLPRSPYKPKLTIAIAGKRHHTRFYPTTADQADPKGNPKPGTVVDRGVTSVFHFDFFLQAHAGLQGTTRPTHYNVVHDDNNFTADEIQTLTHNTAYTFQRATKAVSLIPPSYYADLACERGRCYIHELLHATEMGSTAASAARSGGEDEQARVYRKAQDLWGQGVGARLRETMFYI